MIQKNVLKKRWLKDCVPTVIALMLNALYAVVDGLFVGNAVGESGLSAISIAWPLVALIISLGTGIGGGGGILYSYNLGVKDEWEAKKIFQTTISLLFTGGLFIFLVLKFTFPSLLTLLGASGDVYHYAYVYAEFILYGAVIQVMGAGFIPMLRNRNLGIMAMIIMMTSMVINVIANYIAMFVFHLGMLGAAMGTVFAQSFVVIAGLILFYGKQKEEYAFSLRLKRALLIFKTGLPALGIYIAPSIILIFTNLQCLKYGGDTVVAAYSVISYITFPVVGVLGGVGDGSQPLFSFFFGAEDMESLRYVKKLASKFVIGLGIGFYLLVLCVLNIIPDAFNLSSEANDYFTTGMILCGISFFFTGSVRLQLAYMNGMLRSKEAMSMVYLENFITLILMITLPFLFHEIGIWLTFIIAPIFMLFILAVKFTHKS